MLQALNILSLAVYTCDYRKTAAHSAALRLLLLLMFLFITISPIFDDQGSGIPCILYYP
jgi:hypothetical protein